MGRRGASALLILFGCCFTFSGEFGLHTTSSDYEVPEYHFFWLQLY